MRVLIVGDVHCRHHELAEVLRQVQADYGIAAAIQVGDFGLYREALEKLAGDGVRFPVPVHVIDGNHEDHVWLRKSMLGRVTRQWRDRFNLVYQPRSSVEGFGGSKAGFLGGSLHVDRPQQHNLISRFPNYILASQRRMAVSLFTRERPELIVTHSCPSGIGIGMRGPDSFAAGVAEYVSGAGFDPGPENDRGEAELRHLWQELDYCPRGWVFGHFHTCHTADVKGTRFVCVGDELDSIRHTMVLWDTEEKKLLCVRR